ncbi:hypothetical protein F4818DRAFT_246462 [Hypoxylon cercidicola]|nr:hypothetical protein F4818DRAFT_246462 [Hypoxylon cercidicola]
MASQGLGSYEASKMPRRSHRKSRAGCSECKRRHIKCDESRPACGNCSISSRHCSFLSSQPSLPAVRGAVTTPSPGPGLPFQPEESTSSRQSSPISPGDQSPVIQHANMIQLELFHHCMHSGFDLPSSSEHPGMVIPPAMLVEIALSYPFLMNEMLAIAALHLAHLHPTKARTYRHHAVGLQTHAMSIFNREMTKVNSENGTAVLLFSWLMTLHTLHDTRNSVDIHGFLDRFAHFMQLHRGVRTITAEAWQSILESDMGFILRENSKVVDNLDSGSHTAELEAYIRDSQRLNADEKSVCQDALNRIQWCLNRIDGPEKQHPSHFSTFLSLISWSVVIKVDFLRLVSERNPEALLVLSYYAMILYLCRDVWVIGISGQLLIQSVRLHLDEEFHQWLDWPEKMMNTLS